MRFFLFLAVSMGAASAFAKACIEDEHYNHVILERMDRARADKQKDRLCSDVPTKPSERQAAIKAMNEAAGEEEAATAIQKIRKFMACGVMTHQEEGYEELSLMSYVKVAANNHRGPCVNFWAHQASCVAHKRDVNIPWEPTAYYPAGSRTCPELKQTFMSYGIYEPAVTPPEASAPAEPRKPTAIAVPDITSPEATKPVVDAPKVSDKPGAQE
ncbi:MAG: hypothetical protein K2Q26_08690 [Bdellovibrionales bacterium]|nr:hypothetical protein [Bdellovibrionales bacterium]